MSDDHPTQPPQPPPPESSAGEPGQGEAWPAPDAGRRWPEKGQSSPPAESPPPVVPSDAPPTYPPPGYAPPTYPAPGYGSPTAYPTPFQPQQPHAVPAGGKRPAHPHAEPQPYHQMQRTWEYRWWRPVVGVSLFLVGAFVVAPLAALPVAMLAVLGEGGDYLRNLTTTLTLEEVTPAGLLYLNLTLGGLILVAFAVNRMVHGLRPRWLTSVGPRMRWRFLAACLGVSVIALVAQVVVGALVPSSTDDLSLGGQVNEFSTRTALLAAIVLLTTPLQAAGEEYAFRGYLLQAFGSLFRNRWVAIVVTSTLFALAHGAQNFPLFFDRFAFGFVAAWLVTATGGLEAGIAMHVLNNFLALGAALLFGDISDSLNVSQASWWNLPVTLTQAVVYAVGVMLVARVMKVRTVTEPPSAQVAGGGAGTPGDGAGHGVQRPDAAAPEGGRDDGSDVLAPTRRSVYPRASAPARG